MATRVALKNERTGEIKNVKVGWSWTLFFFTNFFGIPLFMRKLYVWGSLFLILQVISTTMFIVSGQLVTDEAAGLLGLILIILSLTSSAGVFFMAIQGNAMTGKNYLENGCVFVDLNSPEAKFAKQKWAIG